MFTPLAEHFRKIVQYVVPTVMAADTVRSVLVVRQLALDRLKEWEEEENQEAFNHTTNLLKQVVQRCHAQEPDFFPPTVLAMANVEPLFPRASSLSPQHETTLSIIDSITPLPTPATSTTTPPVTPGMGLLDELLTTSAPLLSTSSSSHSSHQQQQQKQQQKEDSQPSYKRRIVVYITLDDVLSHVMQSLHFLTPSSLLRDPSTHSAAQDMVTVHTEFGLEVEKRVMAVADGVKKKLKESLPWPTAQIVRKSALRYDVDWRGLQWPVERRESVERVLSDGCDDVLVGQQQQQHSLSF